MLTINERTFFFGSLIGTCVSTYPALRPALLSPRLRTSWSRPTVTRLLLRLESTSSANHLVDFSFFFKLSQVLKVLDYSFRASIYACTHIVIVIFIITIITMIITIHRSSSASSFASFRLFGPCTTFFFNSSFSSKKLLIC